MEWPIWACATCWRIRPRRRAGQCADRAGAADAGLGAGPRRRRAITQDIADGFWGNGMRVALGEKLGVGKLHLDLRRGDGPPGARCYNFAALTTTERLINEQPDVAAGAVRAIVKAQKALKADPSLADGDWPNVCSRPRRRR